MSTAGQIDFGVGTAEGRMGRRPKLLIVGGPHVSADELAESLGKRFDLVDSSDKDAPGEPVEAVLVDAERFPMLAAELANERAITLLNAMGEGVCLTTARGDVLWANRFFKELDEGVRGRVVEACRASASRFADHGPAGDPPGRDACCQFFIDTDDHYFEVEVTRVPPSKGEEDTGQVAAVIRDVTEARRLRARMHAIDRAGCDLVNLDSAQLRSLNAVQRVQYLEKKIKSHTKEILNFDHFVIFLTDPSTGKLEIVISEGLPREIEDLNLYREDEGSGISGYVASSGESYICRDAATDERFIPGLAGAQSSLTVPLKLNDKVIGIMDVESRQAEAFGDEDRQLAEMFGRHIAIGMHLLDLLVAERSTTGQTVSGRVQGELDEPLDDIMHEADWLMGGEAGAEVAEHLAKIKHDVESIRRRMKDVAEGPQSLLGVERAMHVRTVDPLFEGRRVLVADDTPKIRRIIGDVLHNRGCEVTVCESGAEAIAHLEAVAAGGEPAFHAVISDIKMPDHNGYEVFAAARRASETVPVILMTGFGYDPHHSIVRASQEGLQSVLFKPFQIEQLVDQMRIAFAAQAESAES